MSTQMQALRFTRYGAPSDVLKLDNVPIPEPGEGQVRLRVHAASVNPVEWHFVRGEPFVIRLIAGLRAPKDPKVGGDCAGVVDAVGPGVDSLSVGDAVFGVADGGLAELACARVDRLARKAEGLSFEQAASIPVAGCTALQAVRDHASVAAGQRVLIIGAAGGVGSFAVQIAKSLGAEVTGVCSGANADFVRSLGADHVLDYMREEPNETYDAVIQLAGDAPLRRLRRLLTPTGTLVLAGSGTGREHGMSSLGPLVRIPAARLASRKNGKRVKTFVAKVRTADLETVAELTSPRVERVFALADTAAALAVIESGHVRGKIVIAV